MKKSDEVQAGSRARRAMLLWCMTATVMGMASIAVAQDRFPPKALTIVVPFGPGSSSDASARLLAMKMQPRFGQPVLIENRTGGGATIGPAYVAKSRPDGYTILYGSASSIATAPALVKSLPFDPVRDFSGITLFTESYALLLTRGEYRNLGATQFLERMRRNPEQFPVGSQSATYQALNTMMAMAGKLTHTYVPYVDAGRLLTDLWGGRLGAIVASLNVALPTLKSGQGHIVALYTTDRVASLPNTPTMSEIHPGTHMNFWSGYFAPSATPRPVINALHTHISETVKDPEILRRNEEGGRALFTSPDETDAVVRNEVPRMTALLKAAGIQPE